MLEAGVGTATDITGFGLIGHLYKVLSASDCRAKIHTGSVPFFEEAVRIADMDIIPGGTISNSKIYSRYVEWGKDVTDTERMLVNDAQTSGGLLIFVPREKKDRLVSALRKKGILAAHIGDVVDKGPITGKGFWFPDRLV